VAVRQRARQLAGMLGFDRQDQTRIATALSEIARNAFEYARGGKVEFHIEGKTAPQLFLIRVIDSGPGIPHLSAILDGTYRSTSGMGLGITGAQRLMDLCDIQSAVNQGTTVTLKKLLPAKAPLVTTKTVDHLARELSQHQVSSGPLGEIQQQNQELVRTLGELKERQDELIRINRELADTNRGVIALYAELDEKADHLRRADEMKSRFLSNMSHEFRTPLSSILALSKLLLDRIDGDLSSEQDKQVQFIRKSADGLMELVNDLLDLAKIEAGKIEVHPVDFSVDNLFSALRGMLRPLLVSDAVRLVIEDASHLPSLYTDEGKVSQILRNFISNSLKFTERGEVRLTAALSPDGQHVHFQVSDTGIGIAPEDQARIFEDFSQVNHPIQRRVKGTGLGLPLCRKLATLLGGEITLQSQAGLGSTFTASIPLLYAAAGEQGTAPAQWIVDEALIPILVVEDQPETRFLYEKFLRGSQFQPIMVASVAEGRRALAQIQPGAIVLDVLLRGEDTWSWLAALKGAAETKSIPILMLTTVEDQQKGLAMGADGYCIKPIDQATLLAELTRLTQGDPRRTAANGQPPILIIDDEDTSRYILRRMLDGARCMILEATSGTEGLQVARTLQPSIIFLDLVMPDISGQQCLTSLKSDPLTRHIPVVIVTSKSLTTDEKHLLKTHATEVLSKAALEPQIVQRLLEESGVCR
jgi:signal transduction histidine kinase/CheY-like chemotaxis protein